MLFGSAGAKRLENLKAANESMNSSVSPKDPELEPGLEEKPPPSKKRTTMEIIHSNLESLKYELSKGGSVDPETIREMEERIKELDEH